MISIKKYLDAVHVARRTADNLNQAAENKLPEAGNLLSTYKAALQAMGSNGQRAVPSLGPMIEGALIGISENLSQGATRESLDESRRMVDEQLTLWADAAEENQKQSEQTVRDLLVVVFEASQSTGNRDQKFSQEISQLSERLRVVAGLESVPMIRRSIMENASALNSSADRMASESRESIRKLTSEVVEYQTRLVASERRALLDPLTGLCNRRGFEQQLELRVKHGRPFSLLVADLNRFKAANDRHGHVAGDEILKQFSDEFKQQFVADDTVARWGGDEFVALVAGPPKEGEMRANRVRNWVLGEYKISIATQTILVTVDAALGVLPWDGAESGLELFARADREMYRVKQTRQSATPATSSADGRSSKEPDAKSPVAMARLRGRSSTSSPSAESSSPWKRS